MQTSRLWEGDLNVESGLYRMPLRMTFSTIATPPRSLLRIDHPSASPQTPMNLPRY
jgi:hypothetical protein